MSAAQAAPPDFSKRIAAVLAELAAADNGGEAELGEFHLRQDERGRVIGDFFKCRLTSVFQPLYFGGGSGIVGHEARVRCDGWGNDVVSPWGIFSMIAGDAALVRLDRLCRTLHMLNYFVHAPGDAKLFLRVEPRLLASIKQDHGKVFGEALRHCGISTSQVVIEIPVEAVSDRDLMERVVGNYRGRGYRIALNYPAREEGGLLDRVHPDFVKIVFKDLGDRPALDRILAGIQSRGGLVIASKIQSARDLVVATRTGVDLLQGFFVGPPEFEISDRATLAPVPQSVIAAAISGPTAAIEERTR